jgi:hypothetical protein
MAKSCQLSRSQIRRLKPAVNKVSPQVVSITMQLAYCRVAVIEYNTVNRYKISISP